MLKLSETNEFEERELLHRAMASLPRHKVAKRERWVLVMQAFGLGSTCARGMCLEFGFDPDEKI